MLDDIYISYDTKDYKQTVGIPMGSTLVISPLERLHFVVFSIGYVVIQL